MDLFDDYQDEVERLTDAEIDTLLSGEDHLARPVATLIRDVRLSLLESPSSEMAARHLGAMATARPSSESFRAQARVKRLPRRRRFSKRRLTAIAMAAAVLFVAGLAAAVTLPDKPDQAEPDTLPTTAPSVAPTERNLPEEPTHGQAVADVAKDPSATGCDKGQAVAAIASAKATGHRNNPDKANDPCARAETKGVATSRGRGDPPDAAGGAARGRDNAPAGGTGTANAPGLGQEPVVRASEARGLGRDRGKALGGAAVGGGPNGSEGLGAAPTDSPNP